MVGRLIFRLERGFLSLSPRDNHWPRRQGSSELCILKAVITSGEVILALSSGVIGAIGAQLLSIWHVRKLEEERMALTRQLEMERQAFEIHRMKLDVLRKIAGNRAAVAGKPLERSPRTFL
jgi:hypothetical protein